MKIFALLMIAVIAGTFMNCGNKTGTGETISFTNNFGIPEPKFDTSVNLLLEDIKQRCKADAVRIGLPMRYSNKEDLKYWLSLQIVNPDTEVDDFAELSQSLALSILEHLSNPDDFNEMEVVVQTKKGFILTFSSSRNIRYPMDSLKLLNMKINESVN